ncbi:MAG: hypothetical protein L0Y76_08585 [Ignavibacteria bacterium]|nr:hypothetical protein [Ignavibacteria bacterium]
MALPSNSTYHICIIAGKNNPHSACFMELAVLLKHSLQASGLVADVSINTLSTESMNILLGSNILKSPIPDSYRYIIYQLEQLSDNEGWYSDSMKRMLANAHAVWDYSPQNIAFLESHGIAAAYLPIGYDKALEQISLEAPRDIDILFYGSLNQRRKDALLGIQNDQRYTLHTVFGKYGKERDALIARSKIILNLHFYSTNIFESVRVSYLLNNRCFIVSEESPLYPYQGVDIDLVPYEKIIDTCYYYLERPEELERKRELIYAQFKKLYPMSELLKSVL